MPFSIEIAILPVRIKGNESKVADASLMLDGALAGFELKGFQIWHNDDQTYRVHFPARSWFAKGKTNFIQLLRDQHPERVNSDKLKDAIIVAYRAEVAKGKAANFAPRPASMGGRPKPQPRLVVPGDGTRLPRTAADLSAQLAAAAELPPAPATPRAPKGPDMSEIALAAADARAADADTAAPPVTSLSLSPEGADAILLHKGRQAAPRPRRAARKAKRRTTRPKATRRASAAPRRRKKAPAKRRRTARKAGAR